MCFVTVLWNQTYIFPGMTVLAKNWKMKLKNTIIYKNIVLCLGMVANACKS
jgi:hypothetical protein